MKKELAEMGDGMTRRRFFKTLAAAALVAGVPLPVGFPTEAIEPPVAGGWTYYVDYFNKNAKDTNPGTSPDKPWKTFQFSNIRDTGPKTVLLML